MKRLCLELLQKNPRQAHVPSFLSSFLLHLPTSYPLLPSCQVEIANQARGFRMAVQVSAGSPLSGRTTRRPNFVSVMPAVQAEVSQFMPISVCIHGRQRPQNIAELSLNQAAALDEILEFVSPVVSACAPDVEGIRNLCAETSCGPAIERSLRSFLRTHPWICQVAQATSPSG